MNFSEFGDNTLYFEQVTKGQGRAATDDPIREEVVTGVYLVRPLFGITERELVEAVGKFPHESGNCTYRQREPRPFRLLVQFDMDERIKRNPELEKVLPGLVMKGFDEQGDVRFHPQNKREEYYLRFKKFMRKL